MEVKLVQTCGACPEQYDAYIGDKKVGYLRLRHGYFYASCPGPLGDKVYDANTNGDGLFEPEERDLHLQLAKSAIMQYYNKQSQVDCGDK